MNAALYSAAQSLLRDDEDFNPDARDNISAHTTLRANEPLIQL